MRSIDRKMGSGGCVSRFCDSQLNFGEGLSSFGDRQMEFAVGKLSSERGILMGSG